MENPYLAPDILKNFVFACFAAAMIPTEIWKSSKALVEKTCAELVKSK